MDADAPEPLIGLAKRIYGLRALSGFLTTPGLISLLGAGAAMVLVWIDTTCPELAKLSPVALDPQTSRALFGALAGAAMTALSLVYSVVLLVFTLAAGSIAPRLLERFSHDRQNQFAVGALGALFLYAVVALTFVDIAQFAALGALALATLTILLLLIFVDHVARRVTIDEEIRAIAEELNDQFDRLAASSPGSFDPGALLRPEGREAPITAPVSGYLTALNTEALAEDAATLGGFVELSATPGDHVLAGARIGTAIAGEAEALAKAAPLQLVFGGRRTAEDDLRFSINLLLEIALRALSPGVNDSFTAIACVHKLTEAFARAGRAGPIGGYVVDKDGVLRVIFPRSTLEELIANSFDVMRRNADGNHLVLVAMARALSSLADRLEGPARDVALKEAAAAGQAAEAA